MFVPFSDTFLKNKIKSYLDDPLDKDEAQQRFSTSLFQQVKNHLHSNMKSLHYFDRNESIVNCLNGKIDLLTGDFTPHFKFNENPYLSFIQIPVEYDPEAECLTIDQFLTDVFGFERVPFIYEIIGYLLYKSIKLQKAFIFFGEASSGKTTFIEMLQKFLGKNNYTSRSLQEINKRFQIANTRNKLVNIYDDLPLHKLLYFQNFKLLTTNKYLIGEIKGVQKLVEWENICKQIYTCNTLPEVAETTGDDFWRRIILIHCTAYFDNGNKDFDIGNKITTDKELSGLLNKVIQHFPNLINRKHFEEKYDNIETVKGIWQINVSPMKLFLEECCQITQDESDSEEGHEFRNQVNAFRKDRNAEPISMNLITRTLKDLGVSKKRKSDSLYYYIGIKISKRMMLDEVSLIDQIITKRKILDEF